MGGSQEVRSGPRGHGVRGEHFVGAKPVGCGLPRGVAGTSSAWKDHLLLGRFRVDGPRAGTALLTWVLLLFPDSSWAYTPDSPEVQELVEKAAVYLEKHGKTTWGAGADSLVAMALLRAGRSQSHPLVQYAIDSARKLPEQTARKALANHFYNEGIACIFLCEIDPLAYRSEINMILQAMIKRQAANGAWGYAPNSSYYDDTSQTQYGVLSYWAAHQAGVHVPARNVEAALLWLMRTQNTDGGWAYSPTDPKTFELQNQGQSTHSMTAAGLSSVYICAHLLGFGADAGRPASKEEPSGLPPALQKIESEEAKMKRQVHLKPTATNAQRLAQTMALGNAWFAKRMTYDVKRWAHFYMYAVERYRSFQEFFEGKVIPEPAWYNDGVEFLRKTQNEDGSWQDEIGHGVDRAVDTAFAVLFLTRSSQKSIRKATLDEGVLVGGHGLPKDLTNARLQDGKVVTPQMVRDVDDLLDLLRGTENREFDARSLPGGLSLDQDLTRRTSQLERLRALVTDEDFHARLAAVKTLAGARDLDNVPALIYALSDVDPRIVHEANDGLRFISRRFGAHRLPASPTPEQKQAVQAKWKEWLQSIRPEAAFLD